MSLKMVNISMKINERINMKVYFKEENLNIELEDNDYDDAHNTYILLRSLLKGVDGENLQQIRVINDALHQLKPYTKQLYEYDPMPHKCVGNPFVDFSSVPLWENDGEYWHKEGWLGKK